MEGVFHVEEDGRKMIATKNLVPGVDVYGERLVNIDGTEYRFWNPHRSKLAAGIIEGMKTIPQLRGRILYLGAASGTTASHISDVAKSQGRIFCVEFSLNVARKLFQVCEKRKNMIPLVADARNPSEYGSIVPLVDIIYQDVSQPEKAEILIRNAQRYLKNEGKAILAIKSRSIDVTKEPREIYQGQKEKLEGAGFENIEMRSIEKFEKDHALIIAQFSSIKESK